jgi:hypothetical protein
MSVEIIRIRDLENPVFTEQEKAANAYAEANPVELTVEAVLAAAMQETGLSDFGEDGFRDRLKLILSEVDDDPDSTAYGRQDWFRKYVGVAATRLQIREILKRYPEIHDEVIRRPIIICGLPRSGTTHLVNIMGADTRFRTMPMWESRQPVPDNMQRPLPPAQSDRRLHSLQRRLTSELDVLPLRALMHPIDPLHIEEDCFLGDPSFHGFGPECNRRVVRWRQFYENTEIDAYYAYIRDALKILQWLRPGERWLLKNVQNVEHLAAVYRTYKDATIVTTHRDPVAVIQSFATMYMYRSRMYYKTLKRRVYLEHYAHMIERMLRRNVEQLHVAPPEQRVDVFFDRFMADQMGTVEAIYAMAGIELIPAERTNIAKYVADHNHPAGPAVKYDLEEDFGITADEIRVRFRFYFEALPVKVEIR